MGSKPIASPPSRSFLTETMHIISGYSPHNTDLAGGACSHGNTVRVCQSEAMLRILVRAGWSVVKNV